MNATRTLTAALFALTLTAGLATAQNRPTGAVKTAGNVKTPSNVAAVNPNIKIAESPAQKGTKITSPVIDKLNAADLAVTSIQVGAGNAVTVTVKNVGKSASTRVVELQVGSSGTGNLDNLADQERIDVPVMAAGETRTFTCTRQLVQRARDEVDGAGPILLAANVDKQQKLAEPSEANNILIITTK